MCNDFSYPFPGLTAKQARQASRRAHQLNASLLDMIEREVVKPSPNVSLLQGLVAELMPGSMPGRLMDAVAKEYENAKAVRINEEHRLAALIEKIQYLAGDFSKMIAEAMGLTKSLAGRPNIGGLNVDFGVMDEEFAGSYASEARAPMSADEFAEKVGKAFAQARPQIDKFTEALQNALAQSQPLAPGSITRIVGPFPMSPLRNRVEVRETQPGFVHGTTYNPKHFEENYGPFAELARKLTNGDGPTMEDLRFVILNRNTKYFDAITEAINDFNFDKFGSGHTTNQA